MPGTSSRRLGDWCPPRKLYLVPLSLAAAALIAGVFAVRLDINWLRGLTPWLAASAVPSAALIFVRRALNAAGDV